MKIRKNIHLIIAAILGSVCAIEATIEDVENNKKYMKKKEKYDQANIYNDYPDLIPLLEKITGDN